MNKQFEYLYTIKAEGSIEVEDIGNCCIHVLNDMGYEWFLIVETDLGKTSIKTFGPFHVDMPNYFPSGYNFNYLTFDYKESKIISAIDGFINDGRKLITQAKTVDSAIAYEKLQTINYKEMR